MYCWQFSKFFFKRPPSNRGVLSRINGPDFMDCSRIHTGKPQSAHHPSLALSDSRVMRPFPGEPDGVHALASYLTDAWTDCRRCVNWRSGVRMIPRTRMVAGLPLCAPRQPRVPGWHVGART